MLRKSLRNAIKCVNSNADTYKLNTIRPKVLSDLILENI